MNWEFVFCVKKWSRNQCVFVNAHDYKSLKPCLHECAKWFGNHLRMVCKPNARTCGQDCEPALCHPRMVCIPFVANHNLSIFCANTKRPGCVGCPFHAPGVLRSPQVRRKLINFASNTRRMRMVLRVSGVLVYTWFKKNTLSSKVALCNFDLWNAMPRRRIELLRLFFFF